MLSINDRNNMHMISDGRKIAVIYI